MAAAAQLNLLPKKGQVSIMNLKLLKDVLKRIVNTNKAYYEHISKYGKSVSKDLVSKPEYEEPLFSEFILDKPVLNQTIAEHMYRSGFFTSGETFSAESSLTLDDCFKEKFKVLNLILTDMRARSVTSALEWVKVN